MNHIALVFLAAIFIFTLNATYFDPVYHRDNSQGMALREAHLQYMKAQAAAEERRNAQRAATKAAEERGRKARTRK